MIHLLIKRNFNPLVLESSFSSKNFKKSNQNRFNLITKPIGPTIIIRGTKTRNARDMKDLVDFERACSLAIKKNEVQPIKKMFESTLTPQQERASLLKTQNYHASNNHPTTYPKTTFNPNDIFALIKQNCGYNNQTTTTKNEEKRLKQDLFLEGQENIKSIIPLQPNLQNPLNLRQADDLTNRQTTLANLAVTTANYWREKKLFDPELVLKRFSFSQNPYEHYSSFINAVVFVSGITESDFSLNPTTAKHHLIGMVITDIRNGSLEGPSITYSSTDRQQVDIKKYAYMRSHNNVESYTRYDQQKVTEYTPNISNERAITCLPVDQSASTVEYVRILPGFHLIATFFLSREAVCAAQTMLYGAVSNMFQIDFDSDIRRFRIEFNNYDIVERTWKVSNGTYKLPKELEDILRQQKLYNQHQTCVKWGNKNPGTFGNFEF